MKIAGIVFVIAGILAILVGEFRSANNHQVPDMGLIQVDDAQQNPVSHPPVVGIATIAGGGVLVFVGARKRR
jgi:hypothetical protein